MKHLLVMIVASIILFSSTAFAHVSIVESTPKKDAMLMTPPEHLSLTLSGASRMAKVTITTSSGDKVDIGFKPTKEASTVFSWALPALKPDTYQVQVIYFGEDGHKMKSEFGFMVH
ncbi:copper resistance protein CopC [Alteromonas sediminis]|uniref:Copper resistance protein CopC n=1 Tax=Alteromonas sediminis TaxID=2259342 RepID=A0A3N5YEZ9_9ALTE|nr:copper resistance CopC family protein [Alteromonas sediminis]RPJ68475.1 copper resistance protein CopC [Alteromonas sediminis]